MIWLSAGCDSSPLPWQLDPSVTLFEYGMIVSADASAQMILSPLVGLVIDRLRSIRAICLLCSLLFCAGNILYALLGIFPLGEVKIR